VRRNPVIRGKTMPRERSISSVGEETHCRPRRTEKKETLYTRRRRDQGPGEDSSVGEESIRKKKAARAATTEACKMDLTELRISSWTQ